VFVIPQLENWFRFHSIFDINRSRTIPFRDLRQGLQTCCARDIDILKDGTMVDELLVSVTFVMRQREMLEQVVALTIDNESQAAQGFENRASVVTSIEERLEYAAFYCKSSPLIKAKYSQWHNAKERVGHSAAARYNLRRLDNL